MTGQTTSRTSFIKLKGAMNASWRQIPLICSEFFVDQKCKWFVSKIEEMQWSTFNQETSDNLGLWLGMMQAIAHNGVKEIKDEQGNVGLSMLALSPDDQSYVYRSMIVTKNQLEQWKDMCKTRESQ